ncbi:hypothetical protein DL93DRAFT_2074735 [Clavulina sp. PMI_390]|nr:hypothetical protein DL93DRAFT_2074735 [Clavulina sp. PMI_390]
MGDDDVVATRDEEAEDEAEDMILRDALKPPMRFVVVDEDCCFDDEEGCAEFGAARASNGWGVKDRGSEYMNDWAAASVVFVLAEGPRVEWRIAMDDASVHPVGRFWFWEVRAVTFVRVEQMVTAAVLGRKVEEANGEGATGDMLKIRSESGLDSGGELEAV